MISNKFFLILPLLVIIILIGLKETAGNPSSIRVSITILLISIASLATLAIPHLFLYPFLPPYLTADVCPKLPLPCAITKEVMPEPLISFANLLITLIFAL